MHSQCHDSVSSYCCVLIYFDIMPSCVTSCFPVSSVCFFPQCFSIHFLTCPFPSLVTSPVLDPLFSMSVYLFFVLPEVLVSLFIPSASVCLSVMFPPGSLPVSPHWYVWILIFVARVI